MSCLEKQAYFISNPHVKSLKIREKLIILFSVIIMSSVGLTSYFIFHDVETLLINSKILEMKNEINEKENEIHNLHTRASEDLVFALKNPLFVEYFELPETKAGNVYNDGVLQFTPQQEKIKTELEQWIYHFQNKFQVDETCLIDTSGQEHARLVLSKIAPDDDLSPEEAEAPFFEPSFQKQINEVHVQDPYVSPDTNRWVFAYTSPIVLGEEEKPAIYHFEMPITIFQDIIKHNDGRMFVVDPSGVLIADSEHYYFTNNPSSVYTDYFPSVDSISTSTEFKNIIQKMTLGQEGVGSYSRNGETHYVTYQPLPTFGWSIAYDKPYSLMLAGNTSLDNLKTTIGITASIIIGGGLFGVFAVSNTISRPITRLKIAASNIENGMLDTQITVNGNDELHDLGDSFNSMAKSLKKTVELEKELAITQKNLQNEKLASIGALASRLAHDLRNPLTTIKSTVEIMQIKATNPDKKTLDDYTRLNRAISRMNHQVENVLDFVRTKELKMENISLYKLVDSVIGAIDKPETITIEKLGEDVKFKCDSKSIEVVIINLITNAIQALGEKGIIKIRITDLGYHVMLEVEDNGPGVPDDLIPRIFDPLVTTKQSGTGLGLSSCQNIIKQHGGTMKVRNNPTVFTIKLPKRIQPEIET